MSEVWHVIEGENIRQLLRRAHAGEDPEILYIEEYVNSEKGETKDRPEGREGVVTVYDYEDNYLGCMGIERWQRLLREDN